MLTRLQLLSRIENGVKVLDSWSPNWRTLVDWDTLSMHSLTNCILGQLFGSYYAGRSTLELVYSGKEYGFDLSFGEASDMNWAELTSVWQEIGAEVSAAA